MKTSKIRLPNMTNYKQRKRARLKRHKRINATRRGRAGGKPNSWKGKRAKRRPKQQKPPGYFKKGPKE